MPYWRLSGYYFFYFASLGALLPYWGPYLHSLGLEAQAIGVLMAILTGSKILSPLLWGQIADQTGQRLLVVRLGALLSVAGFATLYWLDGFWGMAWGLLIFGFFWNATLPQMEAITFNHLGKRPAHYALVRLWGSVGFILAVTGLGLALEQGPLSQVPLWGLVLMVGICVSTLMVPDSPPAPGQETGASLSKALRRPGVMAFLSACFLMQLSHGIYYAFYSLYLETEGYASVAIGWLWALGVIAEVLIFLVMPSLLARWGARMVLLWSLAIAAIRWLAIGLGSRSLWVLFLAQWLHAATFGTFHVSAIHLVNRLFPDRTQGRGQALYNSLSFGAGGAAGSLAGGWLWSALGPASAFGFAACIAGIGWFVAWRWMDGVLDRE
ncbi:MFS transporter [Caldichromatium japonicum]|uniref:MFS transporter n=1 Tax=Caldichromatium japonicum TaxID=2699430 RepID=A0A6G7VE37_9GAMM|nr:MFS transporter [Caldichromatium japonicum]QIK38155.1 MFS transporter [Caldichromatium japonicum]